MDKRLVDRDKQGRSMRSDWESVAGQRERAEGQLHGERKCWETARQRMS